MLKKLVLILAVVGLPLVAYTAMQYGQLPRVDFQAALTRAEGMSETEQAKRFQVPGIVVADAEHPAAIHDGAYEFYVKDMNSMIFRVSYNGKEKIDNLQHAQEISLIGHVHGGQNPYFHASQVIFE